MIISYYIIITIYKRTADSNCCMHTMMYEDGTKLRIWRSRNDTTLNFVRHQWRKFVAETVGSGKELASAE